MWKSIIRSLIDSKHIVSADFVQVPGRGLWEAPALSAEGGGTDMYPGLCFSFISTS